MARRARWHLQPRSVADFYRELLATLDAMRLPVKIHPVSTELPEPIRLDRDTQHHSYDREYADRLRRILVQVDRVFTDSQCAFVGKSSPVNFFWGSFDLAVTRFSGRRAPPRDGPAFERDAYSHEVISHGFWPGSGPLLEPAFYAYAAPEPAGLEGSARAAGCGVLPPRARRVHPALRSGAAGRRAGRGDPCVHRQHLRRALPISRIGIAARWIATAWGRKHGRYWRL